MALEQIKIGGFGGQGVILAGIIIGRGATIYENRFATLIQSFGPEARGSSCSAQVMVSDKPILYPYVTTADTMILMSQEAYTKFIPGLKETGLLIIEKDLVEPKALKPGIRVFAIPATKIAEELGRKIVLNIIMVGFFAAITKLISRESMRKAVADSVPPGMQELNTKAYSMGYDFGLTQVPGNS
jgi:2-oxoglutarate ferredoxin oxidoreductase subunit gamma